MPPTSLSFVACPVCTLATQAACRTCKGSGLVDPADLYFNTTALPPPFLAPAVPKRRKKQAPHGRTKLPR